MDLEVKISHSIGKIDFNKDEIKEVLERDLQKYQNVVVGEEEIKHFKTVKTNLNKVYKALNDKKIEIKKAYSLPVTQFENEVKELLAIIDSASSNIDGQLKAYETQLKEEKRQRITDFYNGLEFDYVPIERVFNESWLNATCSEKKWQEEVIEIQQKIVDDLSIIDEFEVGDKPLLKSLYIETLSVKLAKAKYDSLKEVKQRFAEEPKKQEGKEEVKPQPIEQNDTVEQLLSVTFTVTASREKIMALASFMDENNIEYRKGV
jgi:hypothetical protein